MNSQDLQSSIVNKEAILKKAFADEKSLLIRQRTHELYSVPRVDFSRWVLSRHHWRGDERVLDIGCGPGLYFENLQSLLTTGKIVAADISAGMMKKAKTHDNADQMAFAQADVQSLPFADHTFDVVLANHMLFHVNNLEVAFREIHRILKPKGILIAATNSQYSMAEFNTLSRRALTLLGHPPTEDHNEFSRFFESFSLENGSVKLSSRFKTVIRHDLPGAFVFKEPEPVLEYIESTRTVRESSLPEDIKWEDFVNVMTQQVHRLIKHFGELTVYKLSGVFIASDSGGFVSTYMNLLHGETE
jgi:ubiquinone/menaquinone biosynthesis C-methylase UbiE